MNCRIHGILQGLRLECEQMKLLINNKLITYSVHERPIGNASIKFRTEKGGKPFTTSSGVRKKRQVTTAVATLAIEDWLAKGPRDGSPDDVASKPSLREEIATFLQEEYQYTVPKHRAGVETILMEMASLVPTNVLGDITNEFFKSHIKAVLEPQVLPKTWANKFSYMRKFLSWEVERENLLRDPTIGVKGPPKESFGTHEEIWEESMYRAVRKALGNRRVNGQLFQNILEDYWHTGMDTKDLFLFQPKKHMICVTINDANGNPLQVWKIYKKRSKESEIIDQPIHKDILPRWLKRREECGPEDYLHPNKFKSADTWGGWVLEYVKKAQMEAGVPPLVLKAIRHTFATRWARLFVESRGRKGPPMEELRKWMGHAKGSRMLERIYVKWATWVSPEERGEAA